jgi:hypothetical protein
MPPSQGGASRAHDGPGISSRGSKTCLHLRRARRRQVLREPGMLARALLSRASNRKLEHAWSARYSRMNRSVDQCYWWNGTGRPSPSAWGWALCEPNHSIVAESQRHGATSTLTTLADVAYGWNERGERCPSSWGPETCKREARSRRVVWCSVDDSAHESDTWLVAFNWSKI